MEAMSQAIILLFDLHRTKLRVQRGHYTVAKLWTKVVRIENE